MRVLVSGSLAYDRIMDFQGKFQDHILPDKIHIINVSFFIPQLRQSYGGTAGNIAYTLSLLKEEPVLLCTHGNDFSEYEAWCKKNNIITQFSKQMKDLPTASVYIITDRSDNQISAFYPGAMIHSNGPISKGLLRRAGFAIVSPGNVEDMNKYAKLYKKEKTKYIYDPGQQITNLSKKDLIFGINGSDVFISNDYELSMVLKKTRLTEKKILNMSKVLITTLGDKGSIIKTKTRNYKIPVAKPKKVLDPTGAGDAYRAGLIRALVNNFDLPKAGRLAALTSVYAVENYGTQSHSFKLADLKKRFKQNFKENL
ncbi:MAG: carbohydrate kinase family protein [Candidatus Kerfeldbacteria bacterium]|jgi:adenosine kinase